MQHIPNLLSLSRIASTLLIFMLVLINQHWAFLVATVFFVLASITDLLDGYLARRYHLVSSLGVFLDLTADKVFVSSILIALVQIGLVPAWIVVIIVAREFLVTGLRSMAAARGTVIAAGRWGKQKTFITLLAIGGILLAHGLGDPQLALFPTPILTSSPAAWSLSSLLHLLADVALLLATFWTIMSGVEYVLRALPLLQGKEDRLRA
ncbi:CDP-diacylglycerol--glycerol-3-phosphate 3-phosphatidyltransferase [Thermogemmatispora onikobensis]|uniref:CDP-diacylglycerol--glycerol-3-phosphate 3-phosphatidyltransferase n=1 Tax=Thermogemmatispora onikobensis TaxID=732234 RepID=UPI000853BA45|nr:CDP-diacylglycerol--glycerol-3-phosphate 3-phosphatidyltransferase [Thermogemmatispora onikobensis]